MGKIDTVDERYTTDTTPLQLWWVVNGSLVNYSSGYTFSSKLYRADDTTKTALFTKTTGFTGAAGSGTKGNGTPDLTVAWATTGELRTVGITDGLHVFQIAATLTADGSTIVGEVHIPLKVPV